MHCSLAIVASDTGYVYLEAPDKWFEDWLAEELSSVITPPSRWQRVKHIFKPVNYDTAIRQAIRTTLQEFKNETSGL